MFVVSFATPNYEEEIQPLLAGLRAFHIEHEVHLIPSKGSWLESGQYKALFIKEMMDKHKRPIVWIDADTEIKQFPILFDQIQEDVGVNYFTPEIVCGGVLFFNNTPHAYDLLNNWIYIIDSNPLLNDQEALKIAIDSNPQTTIHKMPTQYCNFDLCEDQSNPVLWSRQASRRHRNES